MTGSWCSLNGKLIPPRDAVVGVDDIDFAYGYGVYETLKVRRGILFFPELHGERLLHSASVIGLVHSFTAEKAANWTRELVFANRIKDANIKILLIGGASASRARLYIMSLNPLFPDRKLYSGGARAIMYAGERIFPQAKTLNMLVSTLAFRAAQAAGAYDALLRSSGGLLTEGTRTNLFFTDGAAVYTPPGNTVLEGVTKITLSETLKEAGIPLIEKELPEKDIPRYAGYFLSSTSTKVMPLHRVGDFSCAIPDIIRRIIKLYDAWLDRYAAGQDPVF
jgi:branched-subunit amino acid aminotransferase/4-amino-4-deoxychorismate lyase